MTDRILEEGGSLVLNEDGTSALLLELQSITPTGLANATTLGTVTITALDPPGALLFDGISCGVFISFTDNAGDTPVWEDVSDYVRELSIKRGRQRELERMEPGSLLLVLDNRDRRFDPNHTASPYYPNVLPMRKVKVEYTYDSVTYSRFYGYTDSFPQAYNLTDQTVALSATDGFKIFAQEQLRSAFAIEVETDAPTYWYRLGDTDGIMSDAMHANDGELHGSPAATTGLVVGDTDQASTFGTSKYGIMRTTLNMPFTFECMFNTTASYGDLFYLYGGDSTKYYRVAISLGEVTAELQVSGGHSYTQFTTSTFNDGANHHLACVFTNATTAPLIYVDGVLQACSGTTSGSTLVTLTTNTAYVGYDKQNAQFFTGTIDEVALYNYAVSYARITAHATAALEAWEGDDTGTRVNRVLDSMGWPSADRDIDTGDTTLMAFDCNGSVLDCLLLIADSELGSIYITGGGKVKFRHRQAYILDTNMNTPRLVFSDAGTIFTVPYENVAVGASDALIRNEVRCTRKNGTEQVVTDEASITKYLRWGYSLPAIEVMTDAEAKAHCDVVLATYSQPLQRIDNLSVNMRQYPALTAPTVFPLELENQVQVVLTPTGGGSAITQNGLIESITDHVTPDTMHIAFTLSPATINNWFVLDDSTKGLDSGKLGY